MKLSVVPKKGKYKSRIKGYNISENRVFIYMPDHPNSKSNGYIALARLVMENEIGRYLKSSEHVHHINEDTMDDRIENLKIVSATKHGKIHYDSEAMVNGRRKKYKNGWNPKLRGNGNPNWRGGKVKRICENPDCNNSWMTWPSLFNHKKYCSRGCRL
jgi:hypothetical protein